MIVLPHLQVGRYLQSQLENDSVRKCVLYSERDGLKAFGLMMSGGKGEELEEGDS